MHYINEAFRAIMSNEKVFDLFPESGHPMIMSYRRLNRDIFVNDKIGGFNCGDIKRKKELHSIHELRQIFDQIVEHELDIINRYGTYNVGIDLENTILDQAEIMPLPFRVIIHSEDKEFLMNQLIFDVLFSKYVAENPKMTLRQYSLSHEHYTWSGQKEEKLISESIRKCISFALKKQIEVMNSPELRKEIEEFGFNPDEYFKYMSTVSTPFLNGKKQELVERPKVAWDYVYYNGTTKLITQKQYARSFSKNGNYSRAAFVDLFDTYDRFVNEVFLQSIGNSKEFFLKSMDFYYLETYKRLDFIYKLAVRLENVHSLVIDKNSILVKRFYPYICEVLDENGVIHHSYRRMYYRPMLLLEEVWQQKELYNESMYEDMVLKFYFIRAKVYELFKYHFQFISDDYDDISDFINKHYNILQYHEPKKIWIQEEKKLKADRERRIIKALEINEAIFGDLDKRSPQTWVCVDD